MFWLGDLFHNFNVPQSEIKCRTYSSLVIENLQVTLMVSLILSWEEATEHKKTYFDLAKEGQREMRKGFPLSIFFLNSF